MKVVTISREHRSKGSLVGLRAAEILGYKYMNKDLLVEVAREAQVPVSEVEEFDENPDHPVVRALKKIVMAHDPYCRMGVAGYGKICLDVASLQQLAEDRAAALPLLDEDAYVQLTREVIERMAGEGNVVLIGRGSQAVLADRSDALHVRLTAPEPFRIQAVAEQEEIGLEKAAERVREVDGRRRRYIKRHYGLDWASTDLYHLVLNAGRLGRENAAQLIATAVRLLST